MKPSDDAITNFLRRYLDRPDFDPDDPAAIEAYLNALEEEPISDEQRERILNKTLRHLLDAVSSHEKNTDRMPPSSPSAPSPDTFHGPAIPPGPATDPNASFLFGWFHPPARVLLLTGLLIVSLGVIAAASVPYLWQRGIQQPVARIVRVEDCVYRKGAPSYSIGASLVESDLVAVDEGLVEVAFNSGGRIVLGRQTEFAPLSENACFLRQGHLSIRIPPEAIGFVVRTPEACLASLGADFDVLSEPNGETTVFVDNGFILGAPLDANGRELADKFKVGAGKFQRFRQGTAPAFAEDGTVPSPDQAAHPDRLGDKTLVAWVALDDLNSRGGSALTICGGPTNVNDEWFDGIVFGEIQPGVWMPGSNFYRRTQIGQWTYRRESAAPSELVQIAITYQSRFVTVYRNGVFYARYLVDHQAEFDSTSRVIFGLRHLAAEGDDRYFHGKIAEARIYSKALDPETIVQLSPGQTSQPEPFALWTFENGSTADAMGRFADGKLFGNATVADGCLILNGEGDYLLAWDRRAAEAGVGTMPDEAASSNTESADQE